MVASRSETELIIDKEGDLLVKELYAFKAPASGSQIITINYPVALRGIKARDKIGELPTQLVTPNQLRVQIPRQLKQGKVYAIELKLLIAPDVDEIGGLQMVNWGSISLVKISTIIKPFQVLGFSKVIQSKRAWIYTKNQSRDVASNIARFRPSRIEFGSKLSVIVNLDIIIDASTGGRIRKISAIGPTTSKRQQTTLLTSDVDIEYDSNKNPRYVVSPEIQPGQKGMISLKWRVEIIEGFQNTTSYGSMKALRMLTQKTEKYNEYLKGGKYWEVNHPMIEKLISKLPSKSTIYQYHRLLFEFVNRNLKYEITNNRQTAVEALNSRTGDCSEFADLLTTLHRAVGIPSRVVEGIILENDKRSKPEFHAWQEFLTTKGWVASDPTWGIQTGITSQHIEFSHQKIGLQSSLFSIEYTGSKPEISTKISWN